MAPYPPRPCETGEVAWACKRLLGMLYLSPVAAMLGGQPVRGHLGAPTRAGTGVALGRGVSTVVVFAAPARKWHWRGQALVPA